MQNTTTNLHAKAAEDADWKMSQSVLADFQRIAEKNQNRGISSFRVGSIVDDRRFHQLVDENKQWFRDRLAENEVIFCLDWNLYLLLNKYYRLSPAEQRIEAEFSTLCQFHRTLGVSQFNAIKFAPLSDGLNNELLKLRPRAESEWTEPLGSVCSRQIRHVTGKHQEILDRLLGAAGWLISHPSFLADRDGIRDQWKKLPEGSDHVFPLKKTTKIPRLNSEFHYERIEPLQIDNFRIAFDQFCETWQLEGMLSWELPEPSGPHWDYFDFTDPEMMSKPAEPKTPFHTPVLVKDKMASADYECHVRNSAEHRFNDQ
ncbi:hypothetical protein, partial [Rubinisphaera italica]|uniref:hypothetical protein n=1 Tax=Rubinisphaera italica TaxID=2527969 RepID=UPI0013EF2EAB